MPHAVHHDLGNGYEPKAKVRLNVVQDQNRVTGFGLCQQCCEEKWSEAVNKTVGDSEAQNRHGYAPPRPAPQRRNLRFV